MKGLRLSPEILSRAYSEGYFPMPDPATGRTLWFNPDPRAILPLDSFHCSRSLARKLKHAEFTITFDLAFTDVMRHCADRPETWITDEFMEAYREMAAQGLAHSVEAWKGKKLVGGVYGVHLGAAFFAESKFHTITDASKVALFHLVERLRTQGFLLLEVQFLTPHLQKLGAVEIPGTEYQALLRKALKKTASFPGEMRKELAK